MAAPRQRLTNEVFKKRFPDTFRLVNYAIEIGREVILSHRELHSVGRVRNQAYQVLAEIASGDDLLPPPIHDEDEDDDELD